MAQEHCAHTLREQPRGALWITMDHVEDETLRYKKHTIGDEPQVQSL
jgi:hypothetical protein